MRLTASDGIAERSKTVGMVTALDTAIIKNVGPDSNVSNTVGVSVEDRQGGVCGTSQAIVVGGYEDGSVCLFDLRMTKPIFRTQVHEEPIFALRIAPSGLDIVTGGGDSCLCRSGLTFNSSQIIKENHRMSLQEPGT